MLNYRRAAHSPYFGSASLEYTLVSTVRPSMANVHLAEVGFVGSIDSVHGQYKLEGQVNMLADLF